MSDPNEPGALRLYVGVTNDGRANATICRLCWSQEESPTFPEKLANDWASSLFVKAGITDHGPWLPIDEGMETPFWVLGFVEYKTLGDNLFKSHFCYRVGKADTRYGGPPLECAIVPCENRPQDS